MKEKNGFLLEFVNYSFGNLFREAWKSREGIKCDEAMALYIKTFEEIVLPFSNEDTEEDIFLDENEMENQNNEKVTIEI